MTAAVPYARVTRIATGTAILACRYGRWLRADGWKAATGRALGSLFVAWMLGGCLLATPIAGWATAIVWAVAAYRVSDSSATPPPEEERLSEDEKAGHSDRGPIVVDRREGMSIIRDTREHRHYTTH